MRYYISLLLLFSLFSFVRCDFFNFPTPTSFGTSENPLFPIYPSSAVYAPADSPSTFWHGPNGQDESKMSYDFEFTSQTAFTDKEFISIVLVKTAALESAIGRSTSAGTEACDADNEIILKPDVTQFIARAKFNGKSAKAKGEFQLKETGEYTLFLWRCNEKLRNEAENLKLVRGQTVWINPYGYLPGNYFGYLPFYMFMSILFAIVCFIWAILNIIYRAELAAVQHAISVVLGLCLVEYVVWFADFNHWNSEGTWNLPVVIMAITLTVIRLTLSRVLAVSVCLGWGVVRPTLGGSKLKLAVLGFLYFSCQFAMELTSRYAPVDPQADRWRIILVLPVSLLNSIFYWWIFLSLHAILIDLENRKQHAKLQIYRQFTCVLLFSLVSALIYAIYQVWFNVSEQKFIHWSYIWFLDVGVPTVLYSLILLTIAFLWRPNENGRRFTYSQLDNEQLGGDEFGVEMAESIDPSAGKMELGDAEGDDGDEVFDSGKYGVQPKFEIGDDENGDMETGNAKKSSGKKGEFQQLTGDDMEDSDLYAK